MRPSTSAQDPIAAKQQLAFFSDEPRLFDYLTVEQHLAFVARIYQVEDYEPLADQLLEELEIAGKRNALPGELSRGMKQKLAIACGLLHAPRVIYFDEPLTGLDPIGIRRMKDSILKRARDGAAIIISSHLLHLVEEICSHILILKDGRKIAHGTLAEISQQFAAQTGETNLEEVFFRATSEPEKSPAVISALLYLQYHSIRNRIVMRIKRLKQPKYLVGGIVGGLYFYWYFFRTLFGAPRRRASGRAAGFAGEPGAATNPLGRWCC